MINKTLMVMIVFILLGSSVLIVSINQILFYLILM